LISKFEEAELVESRDPFKRIINRNSMIAAGEADLAKDRIYPLTTIEEKLNELSETGSPYGNAMKEAPESDMLVQIRIGKTKTDPASRRTREQTLSAIGSLFGAPIWMLGEVIRGHQDTSNETQDNKTRLDKVCDKADEETEDEIKERSGGGSNFRVGLRAIAAAQTSRQANSALEELERELEVASKNASTDQYVKQEPAKKLRFLNDVSGCAERISQRKWIPTWKRFLTPTEPTFVVPRAEELATFAHIPTEDEWREKDSSPNF
jgi:hypothetical protein